MSFQKKLDELAAKYPSFTDEEVAQLYHDADEAVRILSTRTAHLEFPEGSAEDVAELLELFMIEARDKHKLFLTSVDETKLVPQAVTNLVESQWKALGSTAIGKGDGRYNVYFLYQARKLQVWYSRIPTGGNKRRPYNAPLTDE